MNGALDLMSIRGVAALCGGIVFGKDFHHFAVFVFPAACAAHNVSGFQAHFIAGKQSEISLEGLLQKISLFDPQMAGKSNGMGAVFRSVGVVFRFKRFRFSLRIIGDGEVKRLQNRHCAHRVLIEILAQAMLQKAVFNGTVHLGHAYTFAKIADGGRRITAAAQATQRGHSRIVPAGDIMFLHKRTELSLAHDRVVDA